MSWLRLILAGSGTKSKGQAMPLYSNGERGWSVPTTPTATAAAAGSVQEKRDTANASLDTAP